ncbi:hypothetical protein CDD82_5066 [Ophiocordyceps australis]|uniref:Holocytochrome c-type synthase n=1 Tax=Ophiocordyceps australis TaxID=1399860 RepID=A0A2C5ZTP2_9HYPO|nr:hypothetical protein CDD82_5066 [Ophiocordyceps australis]
MARSSSSDSSCPLPQQARDVWLAQAHAESEPQTSQPSPPQSQPSSQSTSWTQKLTSIPFWSTPPPPPCQTPSSTNALDTQRIVSTIPRTTQSPSPSCPNPSSPSNHEIESGSDAASGNWVYPSEKMFFEAMRRKGYDARASDMRTIVPIHNAVNERAWKHICQWEAPYIKDSKYGLVPAWPICSGPRLESFANKNDRMTPMARLNTILGYTAPFDRHDWVIDRCGTRVEYVIDFYAGRSDGKPGPSFYLDVRPKLNTWEGIRMRFMSAFGIA